MGSNNSCQWENCKNEAFGVCGCNKQKYCVTCFELHKDSNPKIPHEFATFNGVSLEVSDQPITMKSLILTKLIYRSPEGLTEVHEGRIKDRLGKYAIKIMHCMNDSDLAKKQKESEMQLNMKHPNICECKAAFRDETFQSGCRFVIVMEFSEEGDLEQEIEKRKLKKHPWSESELMSHFTELINAFAYLQDNNLTHGDIKPRNLYQTTEGKLKIGDFGESKQSMQALVTQTYQVTGTVVYFSPLLFGAYLDIIKGKNLNGNVRHNPIKSDVYSLGLSFLHMASLNKPTELNNLEIGIDTLQSNVDKAIAKLNYPETTKILLQRMLQVLENKRHDFKQLRAYLNPSSARSLEGVSNEEVPKAKASQIQKSSEPRLISISQIQGKANLMDQNEKLAILNSHRFQSSSRAVLYRDSVIITGGLKNSKCVFKIIVSTCAATKLMDMNEGRSWHTLLYHEDQLYVIGGRSDAKEPMKSVEILDTMQEDISKENWKRGIDMQSPRENTSAISYEGKIFVVGGSQKEVNRWTPMNSIEIFVNGSWEFYGNYLDSPCSGVGLIVNKQGLILIVGGSREKGTHSNEIFVYDPNSMNKPVKSEQTLQEADIFSSQSSMILNGKLALMGSLIGCHLYEDAIGRWDVKWYK
ncbi:hypothetical protein SteCoe_14153 [Stentor coeruleus]|uniref:Protein kinase domain-containing protein n=1 Tax=Stentor coeruleus TaxID=5963 RepID=A0A1R2C6Y4_9CILI|nr:hypothetical protein SteCoe_14153 [Stentor coeruleus]